MQTTAFVFSINYLANVLKITLSSLHSNHLPLLLYRASTSLETTNAVARRTASLLHYTNFIELKAATFSGTFFDGTVRKSLGNGLHTGYGMEFVWPYLAGWGQNNNKEAVAVVDTICMHHSHDIQRKLIVSDAATTSNSKSGAGNTNDAIYIPTKPQLEWDLTMSRNNFTEELMENAGMTWKEATVFGDLDVATVGCYIDTL